MKIDREFLKKYFVIEIAVFVFMLLLDQISKLIVGNTMQVGDSFVVIPHLFNFYYVLNRGAAFGMLEGAQWFFIVVTFLAIGGFTFALYYFRRQGYLFRITLAVVIAGALGNLIDRIAFGYVRDFIQFAFWESFAIFNFADAQLVVGVILLAVYILFFFKEKQKPALNAQAEKASEGDSQNLERPESVSLENAQNLQNATEAEHQLSQQEPEAEKNGGENNREDSSGN